MVSRKEGVKYSIESIWQEIAKGHEEINGGSGERIFGSRTKSSTEARGARVMVAQALEPLAKTNGRPAVIAPINSEGTENEELRTKVKMLEHTIFQMKG